MVQTNQYGQQGSGAPDPWALANGGGKKSANSIFNQKDQWGQNHSAPIGTVLVGTVSDVPTSSQETDFETKEPKVYQDGSPRWQIEIPLKDTNVPLGPDDDPADDDGTRVLYVKSGLKKALQDAMKAAGVKQFGVGTRIQVTLVGMKPSQKGNPMKLYEILLQPTPVANPAFDQLNVQPVPPQQWYPSQEQAVPQQQFVQQSPQGQAPQMQTPPVQQYAPPAQQPLQAFVAGGGGQGAPAQQFIQPPQAAPQQQFAPGATAVQGILGGQEVQPQAPIQQPVQQAPAAPQGGGIPVVTQEHLNQVQLLLNNNIPRQEAITAVSAGDPALFQAIDAQIPF